VPSNAAASTADQVLDMTLRVNAHFEDWIRERPEQWLCARRRWPKDVVQ
jgi:Kdo2-lipid IVA lauroyltransferase/acyltransferase